MPFDADVGHHLQMNPTDGNLELQAILDAAVDAIIVIDTGGRILSLNRAAVRMFGYAEQEVLGQLVDVLMPEPYRSAHAGYLEKYLRTGEAKIIGIGREVRALRKSGEAFPARLSVGEFMRGSLRRFVGIIHDLTAIQSAEKEMRAAQDRLVHASRLTTIGEMASSIAHEINQPLTAITMYAQASHRMLSAETGAEEKAELLQALSQISAQAERAGEVIRRLRAFVRGRESIRETIAISRLVEDVLSLANPDVRLNNCEVRVGAIPPAAMVKGDPVQLQQVLLNLLRNAMESMIEAGRNPLQIDIATRRIDEHHIEIAVMDHGTGVPAAVAARLFDPFFTTKAQGTGLGLAISHSIVRAHGGRMGHRPTDGGGATFFFVLPTDSGE
jgi:two-component system, LuxR family, sensor kinase FixL